MLLSTRWEESNNQLPDGMCHREGDRFIFVLESLITRVTKFPQDLGRATQLPEFASQTRYHAGQNAGVGGIGRFCGGHNAEVVLKKAQDDFYRLG